MSSRQTYGCPLAVTHLFPCFLSSVIALAQGCWNAVVLELWERWPGRRE
jgi:hypothetical protein